MSTLSNFIDSFAHSIDDKGRVVLPAAFRDAFAGGAVLSARRNHVACYTPAAWETYMEGLRAKRLDGRLTREAFNLIQGHSSLVKPDSQGRVMLGSRIRAAVGLERDVMIQGADDYLAIYPIDAWDRPNAPSFDDVMSTLDELGL